VAQSVYVLTYYTSFGVVFAALAVSRMTPLDNAFGYGVRDGAAAARDASGRGGPRKAAPRMAARKRTETRRGRSRTASKSTAAPVVEAEP
jgi:hypothetical protein